jgi:hypothetical protein
MISFYILSYTKTCRRGHLFQSLNHPTSHRNNFWSNINPGKGSILVLTIKHQPEAELAVVNWEATETEVALLDCVQLLQSEMEEEVSLCRLL